MKSEKFTNMLCIILVCMGIICVIVILINTHSKNNEIYLSSVTYKIDKYFYIAPGVTNLSVRTNEKCEGFLFGTTDLIDYTICEKYPATRYTSELMQYYINESWIKMKYDPTTWKKVSDDVKWQEVHNDDLEEIYYEWDGWWYNKLGEIITVRITCPFSRKDKEWSCYVVIGYWEPSLTKEILKRYQGLCHEGENEFAPSNLREEEVNELKH